MNSNTPKLSIVLIAIDNLEITKRCLSSLKEFTSTPYEIIVIDNASLSAEAIQYYQTCSDVHYRFDEMASVSVAWNKGIERASGEYVAVINNDTVVPPAWDVPLLEVLEGDKTAGMISPLTFWILEGHFKYKHFFPEFKESGAFEKPIKCKPFEHVIWGEFCVFTKKALEVVGGYNSIYEKVGSEDLEMLFQLYDKGFSVYLDPRVKIWHQGNASRRDDIVSNTIVKEYEAKNFEIFLSRWPEQTKGWK